MKFSQMTYTRPDVESFKKLAADIKRALESADSAERAKSLYLEWDRASMNLQTMFSLAHIRHTINTEDEFYAGEISFIDEAAPLLEEAEFELAKALVRSPFRPELEKSFGRLMFENTEIALKTFSPEIIPELQEENRLSTEYAKLIASAQIEFDGEKRTLSQLSPYKRSADDAIRCAAWAAEAGFYNENSQKLDSLFESLVAVRARMAAKLGFESYVPLGYCRMRRNGYGCKEVARFREAVVTHIVPVAEKLYRERAKRAGVPYPLSFADAALGFRSGNPKPSGSAQDILSHARRMYHELSPETAEFIDFMYENELLDVQSKKGKAAGGYCTELPDFKSPFIFANFNGTQGDVDVMTHEAGHAFAAYLARDISPSANRQPSLESCEIHSMSMEFFAWKWLDGFFGGDTDKAKFSHLFDSLTFIPYGALVDHFQHVIYENPGLSPEQRHERWGELLSVYMPWMKLDGSAFYGQGKGWQRQLHIYQRPFYYIDYCLAQSVALQFWALLQKSPGEAWKKYMALVRQAGGKNYPDLVLSAGLNTPFEEAALKTVAESAVRWLDDFKTRLPD